MRLAAFILIGAICGESVSQQLPFRIYTVDDGLAQSNVYTVFQDSRGYLWAGTQDGVSRFDGIEFRTFTSSDGLPNSRVLSIAEDDAGNIWFGTVEGTAVMKQGVITALPPDTARVPTRVWSVAAGWGNQMWIGGVGGAACVADSTIVSLRCGRDLPGTQVFAVARGLQNSVWIGTDHGVCRVEGGVVYPVDVAGSGASYPVKAILERGNGEIWIGTDGGGVFIRDTTGVRTITTGNGLPRDGVYSLMDDGSGVVWIGTYGGGVTRVEGGTLTSYGPRHGFVHTVVRSMIRDREGNLWFGTYGGLVRLGTEAIVNYTRADGLAQEIVMAIGQDGDGDIWFGTYGGGATRLHGDTLSTYSVHNGLPHSSVRAICRTRDGDLWFGTLGGLARYRDGRFSVVTTRDGLVHNEVLALHEDARGDLWVGTFRGAGRRSGGVWTSFTTVNGLPDDRIRCVGEDISGGIWLGTDVGAARLTRDSIISFNESTGFTNLPVRSIYGSADSAVWLATDGAGLFRYLHGTFTAFTTEDGLPNNVCYFVRPDAEGRMWIGTNKGLARSESRGFRILRVRDGLPANEMNTNAVLRDARGFMWFGSVGGVTRIDPRLLPSVSPAPPVLITGVKLFDRDTSTTKPLRLAHDQNYLTLSFTGIHLSNPDAVVYRYRLAGIDRTWQTSPLRTVQYTSIPPGEYHFEVYAGLAGGVENPAPATFSFTIVPPFWERWWFRGLVFAGVIGIAAGGVGMRMRSLRREQESKEEFSRRLIESQEQERQRIAGELHDSLGQELLVIKNRALLGLQEGGSDVPAGQHLEEISKITSQAISDVRAISYNLRPYQLDSLGLTMAIESLVNQVSASSGISFDHSIANIDNVFPKDREINVYRVIQESLNNALKHAAASRVTVKIGRGTSHVTLEVSDNGRGFNQHTRERKGMGLNSITERGRILGGSVEVRSTPGKGTAILVTLPVSNQSS